MKIRINKKDVEMKDIINLVYDIYKIVNDNCNYCKRKNITTDREKLELIKKLIEKVIK